MALSNTLFKSDGEKVSQPRRLSPTHSQKFRSNRTYQKRISHPQFTVHDSPELFRHDALLQMHELRRQVDEHERNIKAILDEIHKRERAD
jgi:hypothetical protein